MVALEPEARRFYEKVERELNWLNDVWNNGVDPGMQLSVLGIDGPLSEGAREHMTTKARESPPGPGLVSGR